jgi:hypothetical protein
MRHHPYPPFRQALRGFIFSVSTSLLLALAAAPAPAQTAPWVGEEDQIERFLETAQITAQSRVGSGITRPYKVELEQDGVRHRAIWKPIQRHSFEHGLESYHSEIAAYRLSRHLGLDMVPPTVERRIGHRYGSLQLWVDGFQPFAKVAGSQPSAADAWSRQIARMGFFDTLIDNPDRHANNYLVDAEWLVVLIDHSRVLNFDQRGPLRTAPPPARFEHSLVERARQLDLDTLRSLIGDLLGGSELRALLHRRDQLLDRVDQVSEQRGDMIAFYRD